MKTNTTLLVVYGCICGAFMVGCSSPANEVETAAGHTTETTAGYVMDANQAYLEDIDQYKVETAEQIVRNETRITELKLKSRYIEKKKQTAYNKKIMAIEEKNIALKSSMEDYLGEGPEKWKVFKAGFSYDMQQLDDEFKELTIYHID